ncbi:MAG: N-acetylmuramoyl-L-alanine amidase [Candidatus Nealsonbacteria bacterium]|nr:N-acetylmuramoyl-L-alanine amidase [Candidatus Nealsonbacteria bacterium]
MPEEKDEKLKFLKRDEVRTMEKDIARLRELESEEARGKIAEIKTGEELLREGGRIEQAQKAAEERERAEIEAKQKEEETKRIKEETALKEGELRLEESEREEQEKERLRSQFKEAQSKEEEARRKFLENISRQAGEEPAPTPPPIPERPISQPPSPMPAPVPPSPPAPEIPPAPPLPAEAPAGAKEGVLPKKPFKLPSIRLPKVQLPKVQIPKVPMPKVEGYFPGKPSVFTKIWIRIVASLFVLAILATVITFWYWYLVIRPAAAPQAPAPAPTQQLPTVKETAPAKPEIIQRFLDKGYYLPTSPRVIDAIIVHSGFNTANGNSYDLEGVIQAYEKTAVATHYLISRGGVIYYLAPDNTIAYHAGAGQMPDGRKGVNNFSIGISLVYQDTEAPNDSQYQALSWLIKGLVEKYNIPQENILGYRDISPEKTTPWNFDWDKLKLLISSLSPSPENGAEFILKSLTLEEKIGQLLILGFEGNASTPELKNLIKTTRPGGIILFKKNIGERSQIKALIEDLQKVSLTETGLPLLVAVDQEGGVVSRISFIKEQTGQPEIKNADHAYKVGLNRGMELKELGINLNLAPVLDITQTEDFLYERSFKKRAEETGILAKAMVSGQQEANILTAIKHFPGYGGISFNPEEILATLADVPQITHFQKLMETSPELVMTANVVYPDIDATLPIAFSVKGIEFLREKLGEVPLIITDDLSQSYLLDVLTSKEVATMPIKAGVNILLFSDWKSGVDAEFIIKKAVEASEISEELIDRAILRTIQLKQGLYLDPNL